MNILPLFCGPRETLRKTGLNAASQMILVNFHLRFVCLDARFHTDLQLKSEVMFAATLYTRLGGWMEFLS